MGISFTISVDLYDKNTVVNYLSNGVISSMVLVKTE